jgi:hypothetical protein
MSDIEVAGAIAPAAQIAIYLAPNTDQGFLDAVTTAIHDATNKPSVISISWGGPESSWTQQSMTAFDQAIQDVAAMGITVCAAAGDNDSSDGASGTGERIRDKIAASKRKGMWMGGVPPLGYDVRDRRLVVNRPEAVTVKHLYHLQGRRSLDSKSRVL